MNNLDRDFEAAVSRVRSDGQDPGNDAKLRLYALYKQATVGDIEGKRPGVTNLVGRAKYDSWASVSGMATPAAKQAYVDLATQLAG